ncbi:MAG: dipeptidase [Candidatus Zixiibacteriota bacterium]|nr:MAG: dipeptidase [candidate division Zixibacteria bacterium]
MTPLEYLKKTEKKRMTELFQFLRFPSVSAKSEHKKDMRECAGWLKSHLSAIGFKSRVYPTGGHPVVYAEYTSSKQAPTILYYGHYDVQPPEPLELWKSGPFAPEVREGYIYARGVADDKGQTFCHIKGLEAVLKSTGSLPINVKMLIEGEEEVASENLTAFIRKNRQMLKCEVAVISDTAQFGHEYPAVTFGLRGVAFVEVSVYGPNRDVHSGSFGGAIANPINVLAGMIAQLHDKNGKIAIPGFYKDVKPITKWEKTQFRRLPFNEANYKKALGVPALHGEKGFSTFERAWSRPTCDVNGIKGGYQGEGGKTIVPSVASCKITMRLVPNQNPNDICNKAERYLRKIAPKSVRVQVIKHGGATPVVVPTDGPWLDAAARAIKTGFGKAPVFMKEGGSIPIVADFKKILEINTVLIGFSQHNDNVHSPNERLRLKDFERGCKTGAAIPDEFAKVEV